jgi:hypothetical protein
MQKTVQNSTKKLDLSKNEKTLQAPKKKEINEKKHTANTDHKKTLS